MRNINEFIDVCIKKKQNSFQKKRRENMPKYADPQRDKKGRFILGHKVSKETKDKISSTKKGHSTSEETRIKIRDKLRGRTMYQMTNTIRKKISSTEKARKVNVGKKLSKEQVRNNLRRRTPSSLETKMITIIDKLHLPYKFVGDGKFFIENRNPDFINCNGEKIAVEVFYRGFKTKKCFQNHNLEEWKAEREKVFAKYGWKIIFLDETQVNEEEIKRRVM